MTYKAVISQQIESMGLTCPQVDRLAELKAGTTWKTIHQNNSTSWERVQVIGAAINLTPNQLAGISGDISIQPPAISNQSVAVEAEKIADQIWESVRRGVQDRGRAPDTKSIMQWYRQEGGVLRCFDQISDYVDLYAPVTEHNSVIKPHKLGKLSLATREWRLESPDHLRTIIETFEPDVNKSAVLAQVKAQSGCLGSTFEQLHVKLPGRASEATFHYQRVVLPCRDTRGSSYNMVFCDPM